MSEGDFTGMDAGEYYAMRDFEDRERQQNENAVLIKRISNQRAEIRHLKRADAALSIAAKWLEQAGACTHYAGYTCDKDFTKPGVCAACIRRHMLKLAKEEARK